MTIRFQRMMFTTALTVPIAFAAGAQAQQNPCDQLEAFLEQDMPEGVRATEQELQQILEQRDPEQCDVVNVEIVRAQQQAQQQQGQTQQDQQQQAQQQTQQQQDEQQAQAQERESEVLAEQAQTRVQLQDQVVIEGMVFVERQPPQVSLLYPPGSALRRSRAWTVVRRAGLGAVGGCPGW